MLGDSIVKSSCGVESRPEYESRSQSESEEFRHNQGTDSLKHIVVEADESRCCPDDISKHI